MRDTFKRMIAAVAAFVLAMGMGLGLAGCGSSGNSEEEMVRAAIATMMDAFKNPTEETLKPYMSEVDDSTWEEMEEYDVDPYELLSHLFKHFDYTINDVTINEDGETGTANITITNADFTNLIPTLMEDLQNDEEFISEVQDLYLNNDTKGVYKLVFQKMYDAIDNCEETSTTTIDLKLSKTDGKWDIDDSSISDFVSAMYGGLDLDSL